MNDLAEQALHGLEVARQQIARHPIAALAATGFVLAATIVVAGGRIGDGSATTPPTSWFGLLPDSGEGDDVVSGAIMLGALVALLLLWLRALAVLSDATSADRQVWVIATSWAAPFVLGPPLLGGDIYTYVGRGLLSHAGFDPYQHGPVQLGADRIVAAIPPAWRASGSTEGPLATAVEHLAASVSGGNALGAVVLLRVVGVAAAFAIAMLAADMAGPYRVRALTLTALNPMLLLVVVSAAQFDGVVAALVLGTLVATAQRRRYLPLVLVSAAVAIKPTVVGLIPLVVAARCLSRRTPVAWRIGGRDLLTAALTLAVCTLIVGDGLGWRHNLSTITLEHSPFSPATIVSNLVRPIVPAASADDLAVGGRIAVVVAAIGIVLYLLLTVRQRPLNRSAGYALFAIAACNPVLYPWSFLTGVCCLAATAQGPRCSWVVALSCAACVVAPVGLHTGDAHVVTTVALGLIALVLVIVLRGQFRARRRLRSGVAV